MNIKEVQKEKEKLEATINNAVCEFERKTGMKVDLVYEYTGSEGRIFRVKVVL